MNSQNSELHADPRVLRGGAKTQRYILTVIAAVMISVVVQVALVVINREFVNPTVGVGTWSVLLSPTIGFILIIREFRLYSLLIAAPYYWAMLYLLTWISVLIAISFYGASL